MAQPKTPLLAKVSSTVAAIGTDNQQQFVATPFISIPDAGTTSSTLTVSGMTGLITDLNVSVNIDHAWDSDLDVYLVTPTGQEIELFTDVGGRGDHFTDTLLDNEASVPITQVSAPFTGTYSPEGDLSSTYQTSPNGEWTLRVTDDETAIAGTLNSWALEVVTLQSNHAPTGSVMISDTTPEQNQTLSVSNTLADDDGLGIINYQWQAAGVGIGSGNAYKVSAADVGKTITVVASYTDGLGKLETVDSAATSAVTLAVAPVAPGFTITPMAVLSTDELGATVNYSISLNTAPLVSRDVTITFTSIDTSEGTIANPTLIFTSANYATPQILTVQGVDDYLDDGAVPYQISAKVSTLDVFYKALAISPLSLVNNDDGFDIALDLYGDEGGSKIDVLVGGNGADKLHGLNMADDLSGGLGNDSLWGGYGDDLLSGGEGDDNLEGEQENDYMEGGVGNDFLYGTGGGLDTMIGGVGNDTYYLDFDAAKDLIDDQGLATDIDTVIMPFQLSKYTLPTGIENGTIAEGTQTSSLTGNEGDNALTGNDGNNILDGAVGRDSLFGGIGNDELLGGLDNDTLDGGEGADHLEGGSGNDSVDGGAGNDELVGGSGAGDDSYIGGLGIDTVIYTSAITDITVNLALSSASGNDISNDKLVSIENIVGGQANDSLSGNLGMNALEGFTGNDTLTGGAGKDTLTGGLGADQFKFNSETETGMTAATRDIIADFNRAQGDSVNLLAIDANKATAGNDAFSILTVGGTFTGVFTSPARLYFDKTGHILYGNNDADSAADFSVQLTGVSSLLVTDVVL